MKKYSIPSPAQAVATPGRRTVIAAALLAGLSAPIGSASAADVVISQIYGAGGNTGATIKSDYIEIFNRSAAAVNIKGWSVQYASATGTAWSSPTIITGDITLQPGQYFLVKESTGTGGTVDLVPDATGTLAMAAGAGKVALVSNGTPLTGTQPVSAFLQDLVGFGAANGYEGAPTPTLSATLAAFRGGSGCTDTDHNNLDFSTAAPSPRNSASPLHACFAPNPVTFSCPATLVLTAGTASSAPLSATASDGRVTSAAITSTSVPGISLVGFSAATAIGGNASVNLSVDASAAAGTYPVAVQFTNDLSESASCTVGVTVKAAPGAHTIMQIQGSGESSPYNNTVQTTEGVVTLKVGTGFFMQDETGDNDPTTSDGIFVYAPAGSSVNVGDKIRLTATVSEFTPTGAPRSYTEFKDVSSIVTLGTGFSITPANIQLPYANLGQVAGMLVRFSNALTVSQLEFLGDRGEITLSAGRLEVPTNHYPARSAEAIALAAANAQNQIILDDGIFVTPTTIPYLGAEGSLRAGDSVSDLTGVIDYGAKGGGGVAFKLQPSVAPVFSQDNPRTAPPALRTGNVKVSSANVLNFFTTFTNGTDAFGGTGQGCSLGSTTTKSNCRGADNLNEFTRQKDKIVGELKAIDADVFGLMEIQNSGETTVSYLVDQLNIAINGDKNIKTYAVVPKPADTGTDAIRVAMIYKPSKLSLVGGALSDGNGINNRPPMAQTFVTGNGQKFSLIVNHLKSKGSCPSGTGTDSDTGDGQGCWNATRVLQAQRLVNSFAQTVATSAGDAKVLMIGDFNAHGFEDPINTITGAGFVNQLERYVRPNGMPYSFVFDGEAGYLDHALASAALSPSVVDAAEWHNNADEPTVIDYNTDGKPEDKYTAAPYRASDHDPVVISLNLQPPYTDVSASVTTTAYALVLNRVTGKYAGNFQLTNNSASPLSGPLQLEFDNLTSGVSLSNATGSRNGAPYITINTTLAPGASVTVPLQFTNPAKGAINYAAKIFSGAF